MKKIHIYILSFLVSSCTNSEIKTLKQENLNLKKEISFLREEKKQTLNTDDFTLNKTPKELIIQCIQELKNQDVKNLKKLGVDVKNKCVTLSDKNEYYTSIFEVLADISTTCGDKFQNLYIDTIEYETELEDNCNFLEGFVILKDNKSKKKYSFYIEAIKEEKSKEWRLLLMELFMEEKEMKE